MSRVGPAQLYTNQARKEQCGENFSKQMFNGNMSIRRITALFRLIEHPLVSVGAARTHVINADRGPRSLNSVATPMGSSEIGGEYEKVVAFHRQRPTNS